MKVESPQTKCSHCSKTIPPKLLKRHMKSHDCRLCPDCGDVVSKGKHSSCRKEYISCFNCNISVTREDMDQHRDICNLAEIECPCKMATGCSFRCQRRDMPVHALEHIKGLLNVVQEKQHIIQDLSEAQCKAVVADFYRDCTFHFLSIDTDLSKFDLTKPNIRGRLETILEFIGAPSYDGEVHENEVDCYEPFSHNKQMARNRAVMFSDTDIVSSLARILLKPLAFTEIQLEYTLKVLYSLVWDTSSSHMSWDDCDDKFKEVTPSSTFFEPVIVIQY
eukprot:gene22524-29167_t